MYLDNFGACQVQSNNGRFLLVHFYLMILIYYNVVTTGKYYLTVEFMLQENETNEKILWHHINDKDFWISFKKLIDNSSIASINFL